MTRTKLAYAAGLFDGEGWVIIARRKSGSLAVAVGVANCYPPIVQWFKDNFGGQIERRDRSNAKHRTAYHWNAASAIAVEFCRKIRPYTIIKSEQIDVALSLQRSIDRYRKNLRHHPRREEIWAYRESLKIRLSELKHVRYDPLVNDGP